MPRSSDWPIGTHLAVAQASNGIQPDEVDALLVCLYGHYTLLRLHFLQEENYFTLAEDEVMDATRGHLKQGAQTTPPVTFSNRTGT
jgi:hypothetical protein